MNRRKEYTALLAQLDAEGVPAALDGCVDRASKRARRRGRRDWGAVLASLGGAAAAFALAVNLSVPFAMACKRFPVLKELAAAVALSPSLKAAVENDFVQLIGQSQTADGLTLSLDYLIFDSTQIHFFYTVNGGDYDSFHVSPSITGPDGEGLMGYSITSATSQPGELSDFGVDFQAGFRAPQALRLICEVTGRKEDTALAPAPETPVEEAPRESGVLTRFTFDLTLDSRFTAPGETIPVEKWVTVDGQRLLIQSLEVNPTHARLIVASDEANTAWCKGLDFYLTDAAGKRYQSGSRVSSGSSLVSSGADGSGGAVSYYLESPHFTGEAPYTLHISGCDWLDKDREWALVDLKGHTAQGLPEGVELLYVRRDKDNVDVAFSGGPAFEEYSCFSWDYRDPEGGEHRLSSGGYSTRTGEDGQERKEWYFTLPDYPWDTVSMKLSYTRTTELSQPIEVKIP